mmetsp:Transcript_3974/g.9020  ORF Transcript_3974/g.9020 Transcript_3974/m.9020 type:complete len:215 (+) Transcript_3974:337-981(+)
MVVVLVGSSWEPPLFVWWENLEAESFHWRDFRVSVAWCFDVMAIRQGDILLVLVVSFWAWCCGERVVVAVVVEAHDVVEVPPFATIARVVLGLAWPCPARVPVENDPPLLWRNPTCRRSPHDDREHLAGRTQSTSCPVESDVWLETSLEKGRVPPQSCAPDRNTDSVQEPNAIDPATQCCCYFDHHSSCRRRCRHNVVVVVVHRNSMRLVHRVQ